MVEYILIYDKYAGNSHSYNNEFTKYIDCKMLFETHPYVDGQDAAIAYKRIFGLPSPFPNDYALINPCICEFENEFGIQVVVTILNVNYKKLGEYFNTFGHVMYEDFLKTACSYHINYTHNLTYTAEIPVDTVVKAITEAAMVPYSNIVDIQIEEPPFINGIVLYSYQKRNIHWMLDVEKTHATVYYTINSDCSLQLGELTYDAISKKFLTKDDQRKIVFNGGALIDEVGLGKTIQMIVLSLLNPAKNLSYVTQQHSAALGSLSESATQDNMMLQSRATLILCPNHLCGQWEREIKQKIKQDTKVVLLTTKKNFDVTTYLDLLHADFVIVSFNFVTNACLTSLYTPKLSSQKSYICSKLWNNKKVTDLFATMARELVENVNTLFAQKPIFMLIRWHRVIVDEFHELFPSETTKYIGVQNIIYTLQAEHKWVVTATPFNGTSENFTGMIQFVTNNTDKSTAILNNSVKHHLLNYFFRRNTKQSVEEEFKLPELKEKVIWLRFTKTECMMYNAYLSDNTLDKYSTIIRQLCCHPSIADEIKNVLSTCKTLDDIQREMVAHYETQYNTAKQEVDACAKSIKNTENRITIIEYKRQRKFLRQLGYRVKLILPVVVKDKAIDTFDQIHEFIQEQDDEENYDDNDNNDDDDDDETKPLIVVSKETQQEVMELVSKKMKSNPSKTLAAAYQILEGHRERFEIAEKNLKGKESSFTFFKNMIEKIKKTTDKTNKKYDEKVDDDEDEEEEADTCGICLNEISADDMGVTVCGHIYCYGCIKALFDVARKCPLCNAKLSKPSDVTKISYERPTKQMNSIAKTKLEMIDKVGTKLTNLIYYLKSIEDRVIVFSQWDSLLKKVGTTLDEHGIKNVFCRGNVWTREKAIHDFMASDDIKVIMLSSELSAAGTNLTKASKVILLDPVSGSYDHRRNVEWQAIGRAYRLGQKNSVEIVRFIIKDTVEEDIYTENKIENAKHPMVHPINEITDDTIMLSDDKCIALSQIAQKSRELKIQKKEERKKKIKSNAKQLKV